MTKKNPFARKNYSYDKNLVFYNRLTDPAPQYGLWIKVYREAMDKMNADISTLNERQVQTAANTLIHLGKIERKKELELLQSLGVKNLNSKTDYTQYVNTLNKILGLKDDYENLLSLVSQQAKGKQRATGAMSFLESYLNTNLTKNLRNFFYSKKGEQIISAYQEGQNVKEQLESLIDQIVHKSIDDAIKQISNSRVDVLDNGEELHLWKQLDNLITETNQQYNLLHSTVVQQYNLDSVKKSLEDYIKKMEKNDSGKYQTKGLSSTIKKGYNKNELTMRQAAGFMEEFVSAAVPREIIMNNKTGSRAAAVMESNMMKTDYVELFQGGVDIDIEKIAQSMSQEISGNNLEQARRQIEKFYDSHLKILEDCFVIYGNSKLYSLGDGFRGFTGGTIGIDKLPELFNSFSKGTAKQGKAAMRLIMQCSEGAIGFDKREEIKQGVTILLSQHMAELLFDDWVNIGSKDNNAIHLFSLNNIKIPLSVLLINAGNALKDSYKSMKDYFKIYFKMPSPVLYPEKTVPTPEMGLLDYWIEQREKNRYAGQLTIKFLGNFKTLLLDLIEQTKDL